MKTRYHTVNGMLIGETSNGVRRGYLPDALGSVVATVDANGAIENTYRYKPYGSLLAKTGTAADPRFLFAGDSGSRNTDLLHADAYNRARHFDYSTGRWLTVDPLWPTETQFIYAKQNPTSLVDPSGLRIRPLGCSKDKFSGCCKSLIDCLDSIKCKDKLYACFGNIDRSIIESTMKALRAMCNSKGPSVCVVCKPKKLPEGCKDFCQKAESDAVTLIGYTEAQGPLISLPKPKKDGEPFAWEGHEQTCVRPNHPCGLELVGLYSVKCDCVILACSGSPNAGSMFHEMIHCAGLKGRKDHNDLSLEIGGPTNQDLVYVIGRCIEKLFQGGFGSNHSC